MNFESIMRDWEPRSADITTSMVVGWEQSLQQTSEKGRKENVALHDAWTAQHAEFMHSSWAVIVRRMAW